MIAIQARTLDKAVGGTARKRRVFESICVDGYFSTPVRHARGAAGRDEAKFADSVSGKRVQASELLFGCKTDDGDLPADTHDRAADAACREGHKRCCRTRLATICVCVSQRV